MNIAENLKSILNDIPETTKLVAVSKTKPKDQIMEAYASGHRFFGENKAQELQEKWKELPADIEWHMIGHVQTNKVKLIAPFVSLVHAVDSLKLLSVLNKEGIKNMRIIPFLFQIHIAQEESKFGLSIDELYSILNSDEYSEFSNVKAAGLMGMATYTDDKGQIRSEFRFLKQFYDRLKKDFFADDEEFKEISMGMSGDYSIAIEEGGTIIRVGSSIFGSR